MIILEQTDYGHTYIGSDNNYYVAFEIDNYGYDVYPLVLGPVENIDFDELTD